MRVPVIALLLLLPTVASAVKPDVDAIRTEFFAASKSRENLDKAFYAIQVEAYKNPKDLAARENLDAATVERIKRDEAFARLMEKWYEAFGCTIKIDNPREVEHYDFGLTGATAPASDFAQICKQTSGITDRKAFLADWLKTNDLKTVAFNSEKWRHRPLIGHKAYKILKGFLAQYPPVGRTQAGVEAVLGPSDPVPNEGFMYHLGNDWGVTVDFLYVVFVLKDGRVTEYRYSSQ